MTAFHAWSAGIAVPIVHDGRPARKRTAQIAPHTQLCYAELQYYDQPVLSLRAAAYPLMLAQEPGFRVSKTSGLSVDFAGALMG